MEETFPVKSYILAGGAAYPVPEDGVRILNAMIRGRSLDMPSFEIESFIINTLNRLEIYGIPDGLVVDVGQDENDRWHVIEIGDCWAMGSYGAGAAYLWAQEFRFFQLEKDKQRK